MRSSTLRTSSSSSSLSSLFAAASLTNKDGSARSKPLDSARSLICRAFVPHVAVHVSEDTDELAREKGFADFKEMIRPYGEDLHGRLTVRDSVGSSNSYDDFGVRFVGLAEAAAAGERWETGISAWAANGGRSSAASAAAAASGAPGEKVFVGGNIDEVEELLGAHLEQNEEPANSDQFFYLHYLRRLLSALPVSPHETFSHPVACVIAISSRNAAPIESLRNLYNSGTQVPLPSYVNADYLRYYVLVHDEDKDDIGKSVDRARPLISSR